MMSHILPLGLKLAGKPVVVVGGGPVSARRARMLHRAGAHVTVISPALCEDMKELVATSKYKMPDAKPTPAIIVEQREYRAGDLAEAWLVATATARSDIDEAVAQEAETHRLFCLKGGDPAGASAWAPALAEHGDAVIAVISRGDQPSPRRTLRLRDRISAFLMSREAVNEPLDSVTAGPQGRVVLVGGGPGAADLLTIAAQRAISRADVLVIDRLAPRDAVAWTPAHAHIIDVGKTGGNHPVSQADINEILVAHAQAGKTVVRLKGGDPYVFGRGGEEYLACADAGIPVTVIPGVTSAVSVPAAAGIPVTHRGVSRGFTVLTGHCDVSVAPLAVDHTIVLLMGVSRLAELSQQLINQGNSPNTPCAVIEDGYGPRQRTTTATLSTIAEVARRAGVQSPAVTVVGDVVHALTGGLQHALPPDIFAR